MTPSATGTAMHVDPAPVSSWSLRLAGGALHAFLIAVWVLTLIVLVWAAPDVGAGLWGLVDVTALVAVQWIVFSRPGRRPTRRAARLALLTQAVLVYAPYLAFGDWWIGNPGMLIGSVLLVLPRGVRVAVVGAIAASLGWVTHLAGLGVYPIMFQTMDPAATGLLLFGLTRLAETVRNLQVARHELAHVAVAEQRWAFTCELQQRLGMRLTAILGHVGGHGEPSDNAAPDTRRRIEEALAITRQTLTDVRSLVRADERFPPAERWQRQHEATDLPRMSQRLAIAALAAVLGSFTIVTLTRIIAGDAGSAQVALSITYVAVLLSLQVGWFGRPAARQRRIGSAVALAVQAALLYLPLLHLGEVWLDLTGFLAGSVLLVVRPRAAVPMAAVVVGSVAWLDAGMGNDIVSALIEMMNAGLTALVVYALSQLAALVGELHEARAELARRAIVEERLRFARDLHDLLGLCLSAIAMKLELASRLHGIGRADAAVAELAEVEELARRGLMDARSVAGGDDHSLSLGDELSSARSALASAGIDVRVQWEADAVPPSLVEPLALAVREGATNVLRHSVASWCEVELRTVESELSLQIRNDGAPLAGADGGDGDVGHGIRNLTHRIGRHSGELSSQPEPSGVHRLRITVPIEDPAAHDGPALVGGTAPVGMAPLPAPTRTGRPKG